MNNNSIGISYPAGGRLKGFKLDFLYGIYTLLIAASAIGIYILGAVYRTMSVFDVNLTIMTIAFTGTLAV